MLNLASGPSPGVFNDRRAGAGTQQSAWKPGVSGHMTRKRQAVKPISVRTFKPSSQPSSWATAGVSFKQKKASAMGKGPKAYPAHVLGPQGR